MNRFQRADQVWAVLAWASKNRQALTYSELSKLIGVPAAGLGQLLEPIQSFCLVSDLPPLTLLVVKKGTGVPGEGFTGASPTELESQQRRVFAFDWMEHGNPGVDAFESATRERPSNGI